MIAPWHPVVPTSIWSAISRDGPGARSQPKAWMPDDFELAASELRGYKWKLSHMPTGEALHASRSFTGVTDERADLLRTQPDDDPVAYERAGVMSYLEMVKAWADELKAARPGWQRPGGGATTMGLRGSQAGENRAFTLAEQAEITDQRQGHPRLGAEEVQADGRAAHGDRHASGRSGGGQQAARPQRLEVAVLRDRLRAHRQQRNPTGCRAAHLSAGVLHGLAHLLGAGAPLGPWLLGQ